jgi:Mrp family chromosome partitioning ATPase/capsular polysaccharide biosynthesis protein
MSDGFEQQDSLRLPPHTGNGSATVSVSTTPRKPMATPTPAQDDTEASRASSDWITPATEERGFGQYLELIWGGRWIVLTAVIAAVAGAIFYVERATKVYQADATLLVSPLPSTNAVAGLGLIQASSDPLRDIETGAGFVTTTSVAHRVSQRLGTKRSAQDLLSHVKATPIAESDSVDIAATDSTAKGAQRLANAFVNAVVADRTAALQQQLDLLIPAFTARINALPPGDGAARSALGAQLAELEALRQSGDPNLRVQALADLPSSPISPRKTLTVVAALFGGLVLGIGIVFMTQLMDPRLRREQDLRERFRIPILARVPAPRPRRWRRGPGPLTPDAVTPEAADAYATIRSALVGAKRDSGAPTTHRGPGRIVLVTGASPFDGKSTTAINLASALAAISDRVTLIEGDLRRPSLGRALGVEPEVGMENVLQGTTGLKEAMTILPAEPHPVRMILSSRNGATPQPILPSQLHAVLLAASKISDWVVVDAPPLMFAPDLLSGSRHLDAVLLVVRLGNTNVSNLVETAEMLAQHHVRPLGFVVVGTSGHPDYY